MAMRREGRAAGRLSMDSIVESPVAVYGAGMAIGIGLAALAVLLALGVLAI